MGGQCACDAKESAQEEGDGQAPTIHSLTDENLVFTEVPAITANVKDIQEGTAITWCSQCVCEVSGNVLAKGAVKDIAKGYESDMMPQVSHLHSDNDTAIPSSEVLGSAGVSGLGSAGVSLEGSDLLQRLDRVGDEDRGEEGDSSFDDSIDLSSDGSSLSLQSFHSGGSITSFVALTDKLLKKKRRKVSERTRKSRTNRFIKSALDNFRNSMFVKQGPSQVDLDRGVYVEELFDFYDPISCTVRKRKMGDDVVHRRNQKRGQEANAEKGGRNSLRSTASNNSGSSARSARSTPSGSKTSRGSESRSGTSSTLPKRSTVLAGLAHNTMAMANNLVRHAKRRKSNFELVASWGVLVGKVLHSLVIDFSAMMDKAIQEKRYRTATLQVARKSGDGKMRDVLQERAGWVVEQAIKLAKELKHEPKDQLDKEWRDRSILPYLFSTEYVDTLLLFARGAQRLLAKQPTVAHVLAPCHVFGDIHGQLRDLLLLFACFGCPRRKNNISFVFNGDFVDRGAHQLEVVGLLFALKLWMPDKVVLVRGNHEDRTMNERYGFKDSCTKHLGGDFGKTFFERVHQAFDELPLACLIDQKVLCVHGGLGDGNWTVEQLRTVKRPIKDLINTKEIRWIADILWSDPIEDGKHADPQVFGVHESPRGKVGTRFAWDITKTFCARNGVSLVVRSHQSKEGSPGFDVMHENMLTRVFSARDYEDHGNDGAILTITKETRESGKDLLTIKPKVLRSVQKARDEASRHKKELREAKKSTEARSASPRDGSKDSPYGSERSPNESEKSSTASEWITDSSSNLAKKETGKRGKQKRTSKRGKGKDMKRVPTEELLGSTVGRLLTP